MAVVNLDSKIGKVRNRIDRIGLELEGGWAKHLNPPNRIHHDGSVFDRGIRGVRQIVRPPDMPEFAIAGEAVSPPLEPSGYPKWLGQCFPRWLDDTCGLHIHLSFTSIKYYEILAGRDEDYHDTMMHYLTLWAQKEEAETPGTFPKDHHIWSRLRGENQYCMGKVWATKQLMRTTKPPGRNAVAANEVGHRYTAINFCFAIHKTLEIRVLPMFTTVDRSVRAVRHCIDITNACLVVMAEKLKPVVEEVIMLPDNLYEEVDQEII
jgi:hypothetical protein